MRDLEDLYYEINKKFDQRDKRFNKIENMIIGLYLILICGLLIDLLV